MKRLFGAAIALAAVTTVIAAFTSGATAGPQNTCPPNPPPGSTVNGGLEVTGPCSLNNVTVNGGVVIDTTGRLQVTNNSAIRGGITAAAGSELDVNHVLTGGAPTGTTSTIDGGIDLTSPFDYDIWTATVHGGVHVTGNSPV